MFIFKFFADFVIFYDFPYNPLYYDNNHSQTNFINV